MKSVVLPDSIVNTFCLFAMEAVKVNHGADIDINVNYRRYRYLQMIQANKACGLDKSISEEDVRLVTGEMYWGERAIYELSVPVVPALLRAVSPSQREMVASRLGCVMGQFLSKDLARSERSFRNILDVFEQGDPIHD